MQLFTQMTDIAVTVSPDPTDRLLMFYVYSTTIQSKGSIRANASSISRVSNMSYETVRRRLKALEKRGVMTAFPEGYEINPEYDIESVFQKLADAVDKYAAQVKSL